MTAGVCQKGQLGTLKGDLRSIVEAVFAASNRAAELTFLVARGLSLRRVGDTAYFGAMMQDTGIIVLAKRGEAGALDGSLADNGHPALGAAVLRNWKLPANVASAVGVHHNSDGAKKPGGDIHALACLMAAGRRLRDGESGEWTTWASPCKEDYGIDNDFLEAPIANLPDAD